MLLLVPAVRWMWLGVQAAADSGSGQLLLVVWGISCMVQHCVRGDDASASVAAAGGVKAQPAHTFGWSEIHIVF